MEPLYIIYGEEDLLRFETLDSLRITAKKEGILDREVLSVDTHFKWDELWYALDSQGLFCDKKLLEIHIPSGKPGKAGSDQLQNLAARIKSLESIVIIIFLPKLDKIQLQAKWFKELSSVAKLCEARAVKNLPAWLSERLARYQLHIEKEALHLLAERVEGNLLAAKQEIEKMSLLHQAGDTIGLEEVKLAIANVARFDIFQMSEAWMTGDIKRLLNLLEGLEAEPVLILWLISEDIRTLIRLSGALKQGKTVSSLRYSLKLWGDKQYFAPKAVERINTRRLIKALQDCASIDRQIKGLEQGDGWDSIKNLLIDLSSTP